MAAQIDVFIDSCAWNVLYDHGVDVASEMQAHNIRLAVSPELLIEVNAIPDTKSKLRGFILNNIDGCHEDLIFGFDVPSVTFGQRRWGGFDNGRWATRDERIIHQTEQAMGRSRRPHGLRKHETDAGLAGRAYHSVVLSTAHQAASVPMKLVDKSRSNILIVEDYIVSGQRLGDFIASRIGRLLGASHDAAATRKKKNS
ncbi:hypothetical protein [Ancylobacter novellus]|nr:hypothetical protein [Ancylobacter novellus]